MVDFLHSAGQADSEQFELATVIKLMLDPSSVPSKITDGYQVIAGANHWLAKSFALDSGKKVLKAATVHAERRSEVEGILAKIDENAVTLRASIESVEAGNTPPANFPKQTLGCIGFFKQVRGCTLWLCMGFSSCHLRATCRLLDFEIILVASRRQPPAPQC